MWARPKIIQHTPPLTVARDGGRFAVVAQDDGGGRGVLQRGHGAPQEALRKPTPALGVTAVQAAGAVLEFELAQGQPAVPFSQQGQVQELWAADGAKAA